MRSRILLFALLMFFGISGVKAQVFQEGFENGVPPTGWVQFGNGLGTSQFWKTSTNSYSGSSSAYVRYENVSGGIAEDWMVTSAMTLGAGDSILTFFQRQQFTSAYGSVYTVRVSTDTSQTNTMNFVTVDTQVESDFTTSWTPYTVNLSAYVNQTIYIAFVMENDDGDNWYLDEMELGLLPCAAITNLAASNISATTADITWSSIAAMDEIEVVPSGSTPTRAGTVSSTQTYSATSLIPGTTYDVYGRALCSGPDKMMISGVWDGPLPGGQPKGTELYVITDIPDLSHYSVSSANNGTGTTVPNPEFTFPAGTASAGTYIYLTSDSAAFNNFFGFDADYITSAMLINGDDAVELIWDSTTVLDVFGDVDVDGTNQPWEYKDGWAYRMDGQVANGGTFVDSLWIYSGVDSLEGGTTNSATHVPFPIGTFSTPGPSIWSMISFTTLCAPVQGDSLSDAIAITTPVYTDSGSTVCHTNQIGNNSNDAWYQLIVTDPCVTSIDVRLCNSGYDTYLRLLDGSLGSIATNDDGCGGGNRSSILGTPVSFGDTINIVVEGYLSNNGFYVLDVIQNAVMPMSSISYPAASYCLTDSNPTATIMADTNGVFSSTAGITLDSITGLITLSTSMAGTYPVLYTVGSNGCAAVDTFMVTINPMEDATFSYAAASFCLGGANASATITGSTGGSFMSSASGLVLDSIGTIDLTASTPGSYMVTYTTGGPCADSSTVSVMVMAADSADIAYASSTYCLNGVNPSPTIAGTTGGIFTSTAGLAMDSITGAIYLANSMPGMYSITYTTSGMCPDTDVEMVTLNAIDDASFSFAAQLYCQADSINPVPSSIATSGGTFSSTSGLSVNAMTGEIDLMASSIDSFHVLIYTTSGPCPSADTIMVGVINCPVGVKDGFATGQYTLFPIPNQGRFFLQNNGDAEATTVAVMDMAGRTLFNQEFFFQAGDKQAIRLDNVAAGTYFLRVTTDTRVETLRLQVAF